MVRWRLYSMLNTVKRKIKDSGIEWVGEIPEDRNIDSRTILNNSIKR